MYKALVTDLDGTVISLASTDTSEITPATKQAIAAAQAKGKHIAAATGRPWEYTKNIVKAMQLSSPCIVEGGTRIIDPRNQRTLWQESLKPEVIPKVMALVKTQAPLTKFAYEGDERHALGAAIPISQSKHTPHKVRMLYFLGLPEILAKDLAKQIASLDDVVAHVTPSWDGPGLMDLHVSSPTGTKEHALAAWHKLEGISKAQTIAMGDSGNDVPLFQSAGLKIAVANATPELKQLADYIAPAQSDEALLHVIEKFL